VHNDINIVWEELRDMPTVAERIIKFLNSRSWDEVQIFGVTDRSQVIMEETNVITKRQLVHNAQGLCNNVTKEGREFRKRFKFIFQKGLPSFWEEKMHY